MGVILFWGLDVVVGRFAVAMMAMLMGIPELMSFYRSNYRVLSVPSTAHPRMLIQTSPTPSSSHPTWSPLSRRTKYSRCGVCTEATAECNATPEAAVK